jgi:predicted RNA-binding Zn ribbon-like protein
VDGAIGRVLAVVYGAMADGSWERLKACPREVCHWVFYDASRNRSGKWCAMSVCGNRTKKARLRAS